MAVLNIRNLPSEVHARLRLRAARSGRSMEAEARAILAETVLSDAPRTSASTLPKWVASLYGGEFPTGVVAGLLAERRREAASE